MYDFLKDSLFKAEDLKEYYEDEAELQKDLNTFLEKGRVLHVTGDLYGTVNPLSGDIYADKYELAAAVHTILHWSIMALPFMTSMRYSWQVLNSCGQRLCVACGLKDILQTCLKG